MAGRPRVDSDGQKELDKAKEQVDQFNDSVKELTMDRMNLAPKAEVEPQTKLATSEIAKSKDIYLKPKRTISSKEKFNEKFRDAYNHSKEYVHIIAENHEVIGENLEIWTKPYPGMSAEEWEVPTNKPVWVPRYLAEQISRKYYHRLKSEDSITGSDGRNKFYGNMVVDTTVQRLDARPVTSSKQVFMGAKSF